MTSRAFAWTVLVSFALGPALAGCLGGSDDTVKPAADPAAKAKVSSTTGAVAGLVVTQAIEPVVGAIVTILETNQSATSDLTGAYAISGVKPGDYTLTTLREGYKSLTARVTVQVAAVAKADFTLRAADLTDPYVVLEQFDGYATCMADIVVLTVSGACDDPNDNIEYYTKANVDLQSLVAEMKWETQDRMMFIISEHPDPQGDPTGINKRNYGMVVAQPGQNYLRLHLKTGVWNNESNAEMAVPPPNATYEYGTRSFYRGMGDEQVNLAWDTAVCPVRTAVQGGTCKGNFFGAGALQALKFSIYLSTFYVTPGPEDFSVIKG